VESVQSLLSLALGFAIAGALASAYQLATSRPLSFRLFKHPLRILAVASVPLLVFAAPFVIMRNAIRGKEKEHSRMEMVMLATILSGFWSLMSGTAFVTALQAMGVLTA
jgi:cytochrome c oxidase assembly factor CtaG